MPCMHHDTPTPPPPQAQHVGTDHHAPTHPSTTRSSLLTHDTTLVKQLAAAREAETRYQQEVADLHTALEQAHAEADQRVTLLQSDATRLQQEVEALTMQVEALTMQLAEQRGEGRVVELQQQVAMLQALAGYAVDGTGMDVGYFCPCAGAGAACFMVRAQVQEVIWVQQQPGMEDQVGMYQVVNLGRSTGAPTTMRPMQQGQQLWKPCCWKRTVI